MSFAHSSQKHALLFVIPAKAGIQIRGVAVDCAFLLGFPLVFPFFFPAFAGMKKGGRTSKGLSRKSGKR